MIMADKWRFVNRDFGGSQGFSEVVPMPISWE
jgi:hypothetical protein